MTAMTIWFLVGVALMLFELFSPVFITVFFGIGAWAAAITAYFYPGIKQELITLILVSIVSIIFLRKRLIDTFQGTTKKKSEKPQSFAPLNRQAEVTKAISPTQIGEISVGESFWRASATQEISVGSIVTVSAVDEDDELLLHVTIKK